MALSHNFNHSHFPFGHMISPFSHFDRAFRDIDRLFDIESEIFGDFRRPLFDHHDHMNLDSPFFGSSLINDKTHEQAKRLLEQMTDAESKQVKIPDRLEKPEALIKEGGSELEGLYRDFTQRKKNGKVAAVSYHSSSITKDGKTVTVSKESRLNPQGKVVTRVNEMLQDSEGHRNSKTWWKKDNLKTKSLTGSIHHPQNDIKRIERQNSKKLSRASSKNEAIIEEIPAEQPELRKTNSAHQ